MKIYTLAVTSNIQDELFKYRVLDICGDRSMKHNLKAFAVSEKVKSSKQEPSSIQFSATRDSLTNGCLWEQLINVFTA